MQTVPHRTEPRKCGEWFKGFQRFSPHVWGKRNASSKRLGRRAFNLLNFPGFQPSNCQTHDCRA
jgi:hypothetical protein